MQNMYLIQLTLLIALFATVMLPGQCPEITSSSITPGDCTNMCHLCLGDEITITVEGFDLPDPGTVDFYVSNNAGFNPYANQGTFLGSSQISTPGSMPCDDCPTMEAIMVNACGLEQANEFIMMGSGSGFAVSELTINLPNGGFCGFANSPNTGVVTGCSVVGVGPGGNVPPGAVVVILVSNNANLVYDFSGSCPNGETIYVLQNSCTLAQPAFRNSCTGCGTRSTTFSLGCGCSGGITYLPENLMNLDGEYVLAGGSPGHVPCNGAPPITADPPNPTPSAVVPFSFTIPASWCDLGPREIVGILNPGSTPPCLDQFTERFTIFVVCPKAHRASGVACDNGDGTGTFDLSLIDDRVTGGGGGTVSYYMDQQATQELASPFLTGSRIIYARVEEFGCVSEVVAIELRVLPAPSAQSTSLTVCGDGSGIGVFDLSSIEGEVNLGTGFAVEWALDPDFLQGISSPYTGPSGVIYARVFNGGCHSPVVEISLTELEGPRLDTIRDTTVCGELILSAITGERLSGNEAFYWRSGALGDTLMPGDTIRGDTLLYIYDRSAVTGCEHELSFRVEVEKSLSGGIDRSITICEGDELNLYGVLDSADGGGFFRDLDMSGRLMDSLFYSQGLSGQRFRFSYVLDSIGSCPVDSSLLEITVLASPVIDSVRGLNGCGFVVLPEITGTQLPGGLAYGSMPGGTGTQYSAGDTIFQSGRLFVYAENGRCSDEQAVDIRIDSNIRTNVRSSICPGGFMEVGGERFDTDRLSGEVVFPGMAANGCDSIVRVELTIEDYAVGQFRATVCPDEFITVNGSVYDKSRPSGRDTLNGASALGCDSIVEVELLFFEEPVEMLERTLCPGEFVMVNNKRYDESRPSGTELIPGGSADGCDSTVVVDLTLREEARGEIRRNLCFGQGVRVNGVTYDESNPSGEEVLVGQAVGGCDSIVEIDLAFSDAAYHDVQERLCAGDFLEINGIRYDASNPSGLDTIPQGSVAGCDSIIRVSVSYLPVAQGRMFDTLCPGESLRIGGELFSESNPTGTVTLANAAQGGCDSLVEVRLSFEPIQLSLQAQYTIAPGQGVTLGLGITGSYASIMWEPSNGLSCTDCPNPVANPGKTTQYKVTVVGTNGCIVEAFTAVRVDENFKVFLPTAFTPNGDGVNDRWMVETNEQIERILYLRIFDRWGNLVYSEVDVEPGQQRGWDGMYRGREMNPAVFVVVVSVRFSNGDKGLYATDVSLLR